MCQVIIDNVPDIIAKIEEGAWNFAQWDLEALISSCEITPLQADKLKNAKADLIVGRGDVCISKLNAILSECQYL
ncbi:hypothetical protein Kuja_1110 [Vibrio phage vB_VchM_Kuja]|uniref:Uncharacterized protein n=1 Tax=Vibrio phage vB_VchM_Kuja TaxID=2686437 RepID=A0A6B9JBY7_9CAUD|nr:hypothetical protein HWC83_gp125 [Vibrio phage vB_VchM_Kuja]QGZ16102.1 hypothetical protein Kuja_1110 [Vibrio phage vB_VchM_Kuja]